MYTCRRDFNVQNGTVVTAVVEPYPNALKMCTIGSDATSCRNHSVVAPTALVAVVVAPPPQAGRHVFLSRCLLIRKRTLESFVRVPVNGPLVHKGTHAGGTPLVVRVQDFSAQHIALRREPAIVSVPTSCKHGGALQFEVTS